MTAFRSTAVEPLAVETQRGFRICVEPDLNNMSTYVFLEQEDWFEREVGFIERLARLLAPASLDVGANLGYYSLLLATASGARAQVRALEPNERTAALLRRSIELDANADRAISTEVVAVGAQTGEVSFSHGVSPELDRVQTSGAGDSRTVDPCGRDGNDTATRASSRVSARRHALVALRARSAVHADARTLLEHGAPALRAPRVHGECRQTARGLRAHLAERGLQPPREPFRIEQR